MTNVPTPHTETVVACPGLAGELGCLTFEEFYDRGIFGDTMRGIISGLEEVPEEFQDAVDQHNNLDFIAQHYDEGTTERINAEHQLRIAAAKIFIQRGLCPAVRLKDEPVVEVAPYQSLCRSLGIRVAAAAAQFADRHNQ